MAVRQIAQVLIVVGAIVAAGGARGQGLGDPRMGARAFSDDCSGCHRTPQGLAKNTAGSSLVGFLRQHYTANAERRNQIAAYLLGAGAGPPPSASRERTPAEEAPQRRQRPEVAAPREEPGEPRASAREPSPAAAEEPRSSQRPRQPAIAARSGPLPPSVTNRAYPSRELTRPAAPAAEGESAKPEAASPKPEPEAAPVQSLAAPTPAGPSSSPETPASADRPVLQEPVGDIQALLPPPPDPAPVVLSTDEPAEPASNASAATGATTSDRVPQRVFSGPLP